MICCTNVISVSITLSFRYKSIPNISLFRVYSSNHQEGFLSKKLSNNLYAIGDYPLDDIPMLKLIHSQDEMVDFIFPYSNKDKIIKTIKE